MYFIIIYTGSEVVSLNATTAAINTHKIYLTHISHIQTTGMRK